MPDYFANVKIKKPEKYLQYRAISAPLSNKVVPDYLIKHIEEINDEIQNIVEKNWTFRKKMYEATEEKIALLIEKGIDISPDMFEWIFDHCEKTAINDGQQSKQALWDRF